RRTAGIRVVPDRWRLPSDVSGLRILSNVKVWKWRRRERNSVFQREHGLAWRWTLDGLKSRQSSLVVAVRIARSGVHDAEADTQHRLRRELVCDSEAWTKSPGIVLRKIAIAAPGTFALKHDGAGQASCSGIRRSWREIRQASLAFSKVRAVVIAQAVVERELA